MVTDVAAVLRRGLEVLFEENPQAVYVFDVEGRLLAGNPAAALRTGRRYEDLNEIDSAPRAHPGDLDRIKAEFRAAAAGETRRYRARGIHPDGTVLHADVTNIPILESDEVVGVLSVTVDVDELAATYDELDRSEGLLRIASRVARLGGWAADLVTGRRYWSNEIFDLLGLPRGDAPDRAEVLAHLDPADHERLDAMLDRCGVDGTPIDLTAAFRRDDGLTSHLHIVGEAVRSPDGRVVRVQGAVTDVTESRRRDELLLRTQRMDSIGTLAGGIAHDLNNVLTPLLLSTQVLGAGETDPTRLRLLAGMEQAIGRGSNMIRQVLTFARGVEGARTVVDITELLGAFSDFCRDTLPKAVVVTVALEPDLSVLGDRTQLLQVLMNLATNARDAMPEGGRLLVDARAVGAHVVIQTTDDGPGMTPDVATHIFDPFFTTKEMGRGTGLGLSVSQAIARTHGGSLEVSSEPGIGTTFRLALPAADGDEVALDGSPDSGANYELAGLRVLIVDDEEEIVDLASLVITQAGGRATGARSAAGALEVLATGKFEVVLTDLVMPGTTGRAFLDWLAQHRPGTAVVTMSGVSEQLTRSTEHPMVVATLNKPFSAASLLAALDRAGAWRP